MKILLTTLNAKFIHSSLALRSLKAYSDKYSDSITLIEFTINQTENFMLSEMFKMKPDIIGFSCYIWNIGQILDMIGSIKKVMPDVKIIFGGPEVSFEYEAILRSYPIDVIVIGEGEQAFYELLRHYVDGEVELRDIKGIAYKPNDEITINGGQYDLWLDNIPFVYDDGFSDLDNRIIYYESSRGCPYNCGYCLSSAAKGVKFLSLDRVFENLTCFLNAKVRQVKFIDRTFNVNKNHAMAIWEFLIKKDNWVTNFHFEVCADLLDDDAMQLLKKARKGLFQFEIGVQSTNDRTLEVINRGTDLSKIYENVKAIKKFGNIHQHLDLIAGLPGEDYDSFERSFNDVFALEPDMLQLGFLKVLKGSKMREDAEKYEIVYKDKADYEVLFTSCLTYEELLKLKDIEQVLEIFYNSNQFACSVKYLVTFFESPFSFFEELSCYWRKMEYHGISHNKTSLYTKLYDFSVSFLNAEGIEIVKELLLFDLLSTEKIKSLPDGLPFISGTEICKEDVREFYSNEENIRKYFGAKALEIPIKQIIRGSNIVKFEYDVLSFSEGEELKKADNYVLFNYTGKEISVGSIGGEWIGQS